MNTSTHTLFFSKILSKLIRIYQIRFDLLDRSTETDLLKSVNAKNRDDQTNRQSKTILFISLFLTHSLAQYAHLFFSSMNMNFTKVSMSIVFSFVLGKMISINMYLFTFEQKKNIYRNQLRHFSRWWCHFRCSNVSHIGNDMNVHRLNGFKWRMWYRAEVYIRIWRSNISNFFYSFQMYHDCFFLWREQCNYTDSEQSIQ